MLRFTILSWLIRMSMMSSVVVLLTCIGVALRTRGAVILDPSAAGLAIVFFIGAYVVVTFEHRWIKRRLINFLLTGDGPTSSPEAPTNPTWPRVSKPDVELTKFYREVAARYNESMQDSDGDTPRMLFVFVTPSVATQLSALAAAKSVVFHGRDMNSAG